MSADYRPSFIKRSKSLSRILESTAVNRLAPLRERNFRRFYAGYVTSLLGTSMSGVALVFAVLGSGGTAADLGYVEAARIVPQVVFVLGGGVLADRLGRRPMMLGADTLRGCAQAALAAALFLGRPQIWLFMLLAALVGVGEALFSPALDALTPQIAPKDALVSANALTGAATAATRIAGPALAGILVAVSGPAPVIAVDAASYGASVVALAMLRLPGSRPRPGRAGGGDQLGARRRRRLVRAQLGRGAGPAAGQGRAVAVPVSGFHSSATMSQVPLPGWRRTTSVAGPASAIATPSGPVPRIDRSPVMSARLPARRTLSARARSGSRMFIMSFKTWRIAAWPTAARSGPQDRTDSGSYKATAASRSPVVRAVQPSSSACTGWLAAGGSIRSGAWVNRCSLRWPGCNGPLRCPGGWSRAPQRGLLPGAGHEAPRVS